MSYPPANVAGYDLGLLDTVSDPTVGSFHSHDPFSAVAPLSSEDPQPQLYTTQAEKPVCAPTNQPTIPFSKSVLY